MIEFALEPFAWTYEVEEQYKDFGALSGGKLKVSIDQREGLLYLTHHQPRVVYGESMHYTLLHLSELNCIIIIIIIYRDQMSAVQLSQCPVELGLRTPTRPSTDDKHENYKVNL